MTKPLPPKVEQLSYNQKGIVRRGQLIELGISPSIIQRRVESREWQRLGDGVYATFTGESTRDAKLWTAVLQAGPGALLSHQTAAELHGFAEGISSKIHISVPANRAPGRTMPIRGVIIHRCRILRPDRIQAPWIVPRTGVEDTVLDLVAVAKTFDDAYSWICRGTADSLTIPFSLRKAMASRARLRWRTWLTEALADAESGINSALERRYVRDVEQSHGLPAAVRQAKQRTGEKVMYLDNFYEGYQLCVELDGITYHSRANHWKDIDRDNVNIATTNTRTMRFGWVGATEKQCRTAQLVADALRHNGWQGTPHPCKDGCTVGWSTTCV
jgi:predicted transcriptional regulator of viral defense system